MDMSEEEMSSMRSHCAMPAGIPIIPALMKQDEYHEFQASPGLYGNRNLVSRKKEEC